MKTTIKDVTDFYNQYPEYIGKLYANSRYGYKRIQFADITAYESPVFELITNSGKKVMCSPEHRFFSNDWKFAKDFKIGDCIQTIDGNESIVSINQCLEVMDLYDLQIEDVKEFYANGIVSHNSSILDSLCFVLFGRPFRNINKGQLINSINGKGCVVEIEFDTNGKSYRIVRGIKPNTFEIYCNDELINQNAALRDYQKVLEQQILKLNYKTFTQVVILGSATFVPFMQLPTGQRREVIEDILDIKIFSVMNSLLKIKTVDLKDEMQRVENDIYSHKTKIDAHKKIISVLESNRQEVLSGIQTKIDNNSSQIEEASAVISKLNNQITELKTATAQEDQVSLALSTASKMKVKLNTVLESCNHTREFFEQNTQCPTCSQEISDSHKQTVFIDVDAKIKEHTDKISQLDANLEKLNKKLSDLNELTSKITDLSLEISTQANKITFLTQQNEQLNRDHSKTVSDDVSLNNEKQQLKELAKGAIALVSKKEELLNARQLHDIASALLKDTGIKTAIIKEYLPVMNKLINKYLSAMEFFVQFELDESFQETIKSRGRDSFTYESFSEGEKQKINLAIMMTWRQIAKLKNSANTNLLIMDEVMDSSLDAQGIEIMMGLLDDLDKTNTIIISHREVNTFNFDRLIKVKKIGDFSVMEELQS